MPFRKHLVGKISGPFRTNSLQKIRCDTFLLFRTKDHNEKFKSYLNKQHKNIQLTSESEENDSLSFLDITITRQNNKFITSVCRKPTFSGVFHKF